jgi:sec-independent protein translocase protein TatB
MNSFFGIGLAELALILLLAGLLLGPQHIRQIARKLGLFAGDAQKIISQLRAQLNSELDAVDMKEMREAVEDVQQLQKQMMDMRREMQNMLTHSGSSMRTAAEKNYPQTNIPPANEDGDEEVVEQRIAPPRTNLPQAVPIPDDPEA